MTDITRPIRPAVRPGPVATAPAVAPAAAAAKVKTQFSSENATQELTMRGKYIEDVLAALSAPLSAANVLKVDRLLRLHNITGHHVELWPKQIVVAGQPVVANSPEHEKELQAAAQKPVPVKPLLGGDRPAVGETAADPVKQSFVVGEEPWV